MPSSPSLALVESPSKSSRTNQVCRSRKMIAKDRLSSLPDDILIPIVSQLHFKAAVRSSLLSRRWVDLWKYRESLDLDTVTFFGVNKIRTLSNNLREGLPPHLSPLFTKWVYRVLKSHRLATLAEFRVAVAYGFLKICPQDVDEWIKFALQKQVRKLEINTHNIRVPKLRRYAFPSLAFRNFNCNSLAVLRLIYVNVTEDDIRYLASYCPSLEEITVHSSLSLVNLDIDIPMPRLKHLEMHWCPKLTGLQVSAPNLLFFEYLGPNIAMVPFKDDIHHLDQLTIGGDYLEFFLFEFSKWQSYQVKRLKLDMRCQPRPRQRCILFPASIAKFGQLRELHLMYHEYEAKSIIWLSSMVRGSPLLHSLDVELSLNWYDGNPEALLLESLAKVKKEGSVRCPHKLRKVVVAGCSGSFVNLQLITYLVENATCIEEMNFKLHPGLCPSHRKEFEDVFVDWVMELKRQLPWGTRLAVL